MKFNITANRQNVQLEKRTLDGKEYLVGPIVLAKVGVMNRTLMTLEEMAKHLPAWGDIAVPLSHPQDADGNFISAKSPEVLEQSVTGRFLEPFIENDMLKGDIWIDVEKAEYLDDGIRLLEAVNAGQMIEVSSGFFADIEEASGIHNNEEYDGIWRNIVPDHAAILLDEIGACSCEDGCGFPRVNAHQNHGDGVVIALYPSEAVSQQIAVENGQSPEDLHLTLLYLGKTDELSEEHKIHMMNLLLFMSQGLPIIRAKVNGAGRFMGDGEAIPHVLLIDSVQVNEWRQELISELWSASQHGFTPHITLGYFEESQLIEPPNIQIVFDSVALSWGNEITHFQLQGIATEVEQMEKDEIVIEDEIIIEDDSRDSEIESLQANIARLGDQLASVNGLIERFGGIDELGQVIANAQSVHAQAQNAEQAERDALTNQLSGVNLSGEELAATSIPVLRALARQNQPVDYVGNGAPIETNSDEIAQPTPILLAKETE